MGVKVRIMIDMDSSNLGMIVRLLEEGTIAAYRVMTMVQPEEKQSGARKFAEEIRSGRSARRNGGGERLKRKNGSGGGPRSIEYVLAIMQTKPEETWNREDIGLSLEADFEHSRHSASGALTLLVEHHYALRTAPGYFMLTDLGKKHPQAELLPFKNR